MSVQLLPYMLENFHILKSEKLEKKHAYTIQLSFWVNNHERMLLKSRVLGG
jgi:hypothetical protein